MTMNIIRIIIIIIRWMAVAMALWLFGCGGGNYKQLLHGGV